MPTPIELKVNVRIPSTPAQENSEFFDQIHNLDPIKFTPLSDTENSQADTMHDGYAKADQPKVLIMGVELQN